MHKRTGVSTPTLAAAAAKSGKGGVPAPDVRSRLLNRTEAVQRQVKVQERADRPKMKTVVKGGGAQDMDGVRRKNRHGEGQEQDDDEFDYEEDFQDDEEGVAKIDDLADEEEAKELEVGTVSATWLELY